MPPRHGPRSSAAAPPAKTSRSRARAEASTASAPASGGSSPASSESSTPTFSFGRTSQLPLFELCLPFCAPLPRSGGMRNGQPSARPMLVRRISATASSSSPHKADYPTPTASPYGKSGNARGHGERRRESLDAMAARWPTPLGSDETRGARLPDGKRGESLPEAVTRWPTATSQDAADSGAAAYSTSSGRHSGTTLVDAARLHAGLPAEEMRTAGPDGLVLCPEFVEALMGFPEGWTHVDDGPASEALATPSSRPKRPRRSQSSGVDS